MANFSFSRDDRLKSVKLIRTLFKKGQSLFQFPIKLVYLPLLEGDTTLLRTQYAVSVPKKRFKKAVDRNRIKRLLRESIRHNKILLAEDPPFYMMIIYVGNEELPYKKIDSSIKKLLLQLHRIATSEP